MNCTNDPNASVTQFVYKTYTILHDYFSNLDHNENETKTWFLMRFDLVDYFMIAIFAFTWKCMREFFMKNISQVSSYNFLVETLVSTIYSLDNLSPVAATTNVAERESFNLHSGFV